MYRAAVAEVRRRQALGGATEGSEAANALLCAGPFFHILLCLFIECCHAVADSGHMSYRIEYMIAAIRAIKPITIANRAMARIPRI